MNKYTLVGGVNLLLGLVGLVVPSVLLFFVIPGVAQVYEELGVTPSLYGSYVGVGLGILIGLGNLFLGYKLFSPAIQNKDTYFQAGVLAIVATFFLSAILYVFISASALTPLYNLVGEIGEIK